MCLFTSSPAVLLMHVWTEWGVHHLALAFHQLMGHLICPDSAVTRNSRSHKHAVGKKTVPLELLHLALALALFPVNDSVLVFFLKKGINSMLCLPPSPSAQICFPLWSKIIPHANLSNRDSEPGEKTGIVVSVLPQTLLPVTVQAFQWERPRCSETPSVQSLEVAGVRTMCTTMAVLTTIALILRHRFSSKIKPWVMPALLKYVWIKRAEGQKSPLQTFIQFTLVETG